MTQMKRRDFLKASAAIAAAGAAGGFGCVEIASAAPITVPTVDKLTMRVLIDSSHDQFLRPKTVGGVQSIPPGAGRGADYRKVLHNQWGLSLFLETQQGADQRAVLLDFGYSPDALVNNIEILKVDPTKVSALIVSHGHFDHFGGLQGFLDKYRDKLSPDLKLYAGGEDNFCQRFAGPANSLTEFGVLDRRELSAKKVTVVLCETPTVVGHAFTTGKIKRSGIERILPNTSVQWSEKDGLGCNVGHYAPAELAGKIVPDEHVHEHATVFNIKDKGLVVISSCGHVGIVNSVKQAQEVSGIQKVHAVVGGFHLGPAPGDYLKQIVTELEKLNPDVIIPMHCSGDNFVRQVREQLPNKLLESTTGNQYVFGA
ncbi:MAG: MBL fold metallo-hydrolase [Pseudolabrys sp.]|nr:MBL fold metallo-hydrolase [Pseudolabrys sp.]